MFFLRNKKAEKSVSYPLIVKDGALYVERGQQYDESLYETDSDFDEDELDDSSQEATLENHHVHDTVPDHSQISTDPNNITESPMGDENKSAQHRIDPTIDYPGDPTIDYPGSAVTDEIKAHTTEELETSLNIVDNHARTTPTEEQKDLDAEETTTIDEKKALLYLAAKHDRVDIIQSVLKPTGSDIASTGHWATFLLNNRLPTSSHGDFVEANLEQVFLPPLHLAVGFSSVNAASCMLRLGADPSIRPHIPNDWPGPIGLEDQGNISWKIFNGLSAWESVLYEDPLGTSNIYKSNSGSPKSWFKWSSSSDTSESNREANRILDISPSKREGLKHAFLSEALRAIGSDDVLRFRELLDCGINDDPKSRTVLGGKDLKEWCIEMNALGCIQLLEESPKGHDTEIVRDNHSTMSGPNAQDHSVSQSAVLNQLMENEALLNALSSILDNLADEVSITRDLLVDNSSNDAFLSQVRTLKILREQKENDIITWTKYLSNTSAELEYATLEWKNLGGDDDILLQVSQIDDKQRGLKAKQPDKSGDRKLTDNTSIHSLSSELALSEGKIHKLRSAINELAAENSDNLIKIEKKGLIGAVQLARTLREDLRVKEEELQGLKNQEEFYRSQLIFLKTRIHDFLQEQDNTLNAEYVPPSEDDERSREGENAPQHNRTLIYHADSFVPTPETAEDALAETGIDSADEVGILEEYNNNQLEESKAMMLRQDQYLPIRVWDLILRIMGLGREAVKRSFHRNGADELSRIMIV